jgi:hypothetical protein
MYMTHIHNDYKGDVYFPEVNWDEWKKTEEEAHEEYTYATYIRKS